MPKWLKPLRYHRPEVPNATFPSLPQGAPTCRRRHFGVPPGALKWCKIAFAHSLAPRCVRERLKSRKSVPLGLQGWQKWPKRSLKGGKMEAKWSLKFHFFKKVQYVSSIHYLLHISHIGTSKKRHFSYPGEGKNKVRTVWCLQCRLGAAKW